MFIKCYCLLKWCLLVVSDFSDDFRPSVPSSPSVFRILTHPHQINVRIFSPSWPSSVQPSIGMFEVVTLNWSLKPAISWSLFEHGLEPTSPFVENFCFSSEWSGTSSKPSATYCAVHDVILGPTLSSSSLTNWIFECSKCLHSGPLLGTNIAMVLSLSKFNEG